MIPLTVEQLKTHPDKPKYCIECYINADPIIGGDANRLVNPGVRYGIVESIGWVDWVCEDHLDLVTEEIKRDDT